MTRPPLTAGSGTCACGKPVPTSRSNRPRKHCSRACALEANRVGNRRRYAEIVAGQRAPEERAAQQTPWIGLKLAERIGLPGYPPPRLLEPVEEPCEPPADEWEGVA